MGDEREKIQNLKKKCEELHSQLARVDAALLGLTCRHRNGDNTCGHARFTMKKYPQHEPVAPPCGIEICPR